MPALNHVLKHTATPESVTADELPDPPDPLNPTNWVEGEPDESEKPGTPFKCCLFLPLGTEETSPRGRRVVKRPTLLIARLDAQRNPVVVKSDMELDIVAPELTGPTAVRWQVEGEPQPFGKPGRPIIGSQCYLKRVED